ncbi:hypothetical protein [Clostridium acetobutylicum]|uniref:hypothetical protein n=1 Tax=Clostridium acetobutylicum TaxID=1488 RepID=UPI0017E80BA3|nr:hypothetical protein [Clostridium acetobutylicum]NYC94891.1 hypothetical protein [Clostridium acetobutylicum]
MDYVFSEDELIKILAKDPNVKNSRGCSKYIEELFKNLFQQMFKGELDEHIGYAKHNYKDKIFHFKLQNLIFYFW